MAGKGSQRVSERFFLFGPAYPRELRHLGPLREYPLREYGDQSSPCLSRGEMTALTGTGSAGREKRRPSACCGAVERNRG